MIARLMVSGLLFLSLLMLFVCPVQAIVATTTIYVDTDAPGPTHDGTSWSNAHLDLQNALTAATSGDEIWVAEGTYKPSNEVGGTGPRYATFQMKNSVAIYGGFDPSVGDDKWKERNWENNVTILSGDIGTVGDTSDNCYHVFYHPAGTGLVPSAILDGFIITGSNASGPSPQCEGGGIHNYSSSPTITNCTFSGNSANYGSGIYNEYSSPTVTKCTFSVNNGDDGGGIFNISESSPAITDCTFSGNSVGGYGGGIFNHHRSSPAITDCTFSGNSVGKYGGGIFNYECSPTLFNCVFSSNSAGDDGGGIYNVYSTPTIVNSVFSNNMASTDGGGILNVYSSPELVNCSFSNNTADRGGGMFDADDSWPILTNCIFWNNEATTSGSQIFQTWNTHVMAPVISYSDIQGSGGSTSWDPLLGTDDGGNIDADPEFYDPLNGNFHLTLASPCLDTGTNTGAPATDFEGDIRPFDGDGNGTPTTDMGADEWVKIDPTKPVPELPTILILSIGLLGLGGFFFWRQRTTLRVSSV